MRLLLVFLWFFLNWLYLWFELFLGCLGLWYLGRFRFLFLRLSGSLIFGKVLFLVVAGILFNLNWLFLNNNFIILIIILIFLMVVIIIKVWSIGCASIHLIVVVIITTLKELTFQDDSFKVIILIGGWIFIVTVGVVVIVELIVPASVLVEEVNVLAGFDFEALATGDFSEDLETQGIGAGVGLHDGWVSRE